MGRGRKIYIHWLLCITIVLLYEAVSAYPVYAIEMNEENNIEAIDDNVSISLDDKVVTLENTIDENNTEKKTRILILVKKILLKKMRKKLIQSM